MTTNLCESSISNDIQRATGLYKLAQTLIEKYQGNKSNIKLIDEILCLLNEAITLYDNYSAAYNDRGCIYEHLCLYNSALKEYCLAIDTSKDNKQSDYYYNRGNINRILENWDEAIYDYDSAIRLDPNNIHAVENKQRLIKQLGIKK
jgi:tetratricopeptide (TPR) repeat protein